MRCALVRHLTLEPTRHRAEPSARFHLGVECEPGRRAVADCALKRGPHACCQRFFGLGAGETRPREQQGGNCDELQCPHIFDCDEGARSRPFRSAGRRHRAALDIRRRHSSDRARRSRSGAGYRSTPCRRTSHPVARPDRPAGLRCRPLRARRADDLPCLSTCGFLPIPMGTMATRNGAIASGKMMPRASWSCSIAAPTIRETPMP